MWFERLTGFREKSPERVRRNLQLDGEYLISTVNGRKIRCGRLEIPTLEDQRKEISIPSDGDVQISISEVVGDVAEMHKDPANANSVFQAASQLNLLEMVDQYVTPEKGVGIYENDHTQGPACAIACGGGTIFRNYFVELEGQIGQTENNQVDCLDEVGKILGNENNRLWKMQNGYALAKPDGLAKIRKQLDQLDSAGLELLQGRLKVGIQWNAEVTGSKDLHTVSQVYCAALPIGYSGIQAVHWEPFARLVLEATYEATFYAALKNYQITGNPRLYLTLVGGGVFENEMQWILDAIEKAVLKFNSIPLKVSIVSFKRSKPEVANFVGEFDPG
jgi:hypothetical protein